MVTCTSRLVTDATDPREVCFVTVDSSALKIEVLEWHVRDYLQPLVARVKVPRCRCHGAG